jgi:DNA-binding winged helix-turn-helix (wHTH) protein
MSNITVLSRPNSFNPTRSPRGFALYVGLDEAKAAAAGVSFSMLVDALKRTLADLVPEAETHATAALAPEGVGGRDLDIVRAALGAPGSVGGGMPASPARPTDPRVTLDFSRKRVEIQGASVGMTYTEMELLEYLVLNEGRTVERAELIQAFWGTGSPDVPSERAIDAHMRRMRVKLGAFEDILRTVRGTGYRFDRHADVEIVSTAVVVA